MALHDPSPAAHHADAAFAERYGAQDEPAVTLGLVVGWPDESRPADVKPRLPQANVLHHERYVLDRRHAWRSYDGPSRAFQRLQGLDPVGRVAQPPAGGRSAASLTGRDRLGEALRSLGFGLK